MQIRIETAIDPAAVTKFLEEHDLRVPVFFDQNEHIVITVNRNIRTRASLILLIEWLMAQ